MGKTKIRKPNTDACSMLEFRAALRKAPEGQHFVLNDGRSLQHAKDLADALEHMDDDTFKHHVNEHKNDFSNWSEHVLEDKELAEDLKLATTQVHTQLTVLKHIAKHVG